MGEKISFEPKGKIKVSGEYFPEEVDEEKRILNNDIDKEGKYTTYTTKFVPLDEIPEKEHPTIEEDDKEGEDEVEQLLEEDHLTNAENIAKKEEKIGLITGEDGNTAHVGPEFYDKGEEISGLVNNKKENFTYDYNGDDEEETIPKNEPVQLQSIVASPTKEPVSHVGHEKYGLESRKMRKNPKAEGKDNLKTMLQSKKERSFRERIRKFLHGEDTFSSLN
jgi:hypothetical protein